MKEKEENRKKSVKSAYFTAMPLLGTYQGKMKTYVHRKTCAWILRAALFVIVNNWNEAKCPLVGEWINEFWYIHSMEY